MNIYILIFIYVFFFGFFKIFVLKPSSQISEFKGAAVRNDSGKHLKTVIQPSEEDKNV